MKKKRRHHELVECSVRASSLYSTDVDVSPAKLKERSQRFSSPPSTLRSLERVRAGDASLPHTPLRGVELDSLLNEVWSRWAAVERQDGCLHSDDDVYLWAVETLRRTVSDALVTSDTACLDKAHKMMTVIALSVGDFAQARVSVGGLLNSKLFGGEAVNDRCRYLCYALLLSLISPETALIESECISLYVTTADSSTEIVAWARALSRAVISGDCTRTIALSRIAGEYDMYAVFAVAPVLDTAMEQLLHSMCLAFRPSGVPLSFVVEPLGFVEEAACAEWLRHCRSFMLFVTDGEQLIIPRRE